MVNPGIKYQPKKNEKRKIAGVAIVLKDFLELLDKYGISHESESVLRKRLRASKDIVTSSKQHFLSPSSREVKISRNSGEVSCISCICIPRSLIPEDTLKVLTEGN